MINPTKVANLTARGVARNERQRDKQGPLDVWTNTWDGAVQNEQEFWTDPAEQIRADWDSQMQQVEALGISQWASTSYSDTQDAFIANAEGVGDAAYKIAEADGALPTVGAVFGTLIALEQALSVAFSMIPFPALPAVRVTDMAIGLPHAHMHPPNLIPPNPVPVPLPSAGPVIPIPFISGAATVLINNLPAARCGDMGMGIWCGGYFPMYEIFLGSSSVWLEGARAARIGIDITKHCIFTTPKPSDPPVGPMIGTTVSASPNTIIGGFPLPSLTSMAAGQAFKAMFKGLGKLRGLMRSADDVAEEVGEAAGRPGAFSPPKGFEDEITEQFAVPEQVLGHRELLDIAQSVNPNNGTINCGHIIDAVDGRLSGRSPNQITLTMGDDGNWQDISRRFDASAFVNSSYEEAFEYVSQKEGRRALLGIQHQGGGSHVVVLANNKGAVGIVEGQGGGSVFTSPQAARNAYPPNDKVMVAIY